MNRNTLKKIVAIVTSLTVFVWLAGPGVAQGLTANELQAQIAALLAQLNQLQGQLTILQGTPSPSSACSGITFTRTLKQGSSGNDVKCLQAILNQSADTQIAASGVGSSGSETTYFGAKTKIAVVKFQVKYASEILTPVGLTAGTGLVGAKTMAKLNTMTGGTPPPGTVCGNGTCETGETTANCPADCPSGAGQNKVYLAADTPAAASIAKARDVIFAKINFCAASQANTISKIVLTRGGIAQDADVSNVKLYEGITQIGSTQAINTTLHTASFASLNWTIAANSCKVLTVKVTIDPGATTGDTLKFSINAAPDITSTVALDGIFPITSNGMTLAGVGTGGVEISTTTPSGGSVVAGGLSQDIAGFRFTASDTEAVNITSIAVTQVGSAVPFDITNLKLFYGSDQLGSTVTALGSNGKAAFDLSSNPLSILASNSKTIKVVIDIGASVGIKDRTVNFEITDETDVTAYGANSGGSLKIYGGTTFGSTWPQRNANVSIQLGTLVIDSSTEYSPSAQPYAKGTLQDSIVAFKFSAGANEGVRITQLKLKRASSTLDTDISNVTLYDAVTGLQIQDTSGNTVPSASMSGGYVTFGSYTSGLDATGLFDIEKAKTKYILVKADVPSGAATYDNSLGLIINAPQTDIKADGLASRNDLTSTEITPGSQKPAAGSEILHNIIAKGALTIQTSANTPQAATYAIGISNYDFAYFDFITTGEDITISQLNVNFETSSDKTATASPAAASDVNNVRIYDGDTLLKSDDTISSGKATFGISFTVPKNTTKTLKVKADIPSTSVSGSSYLTAQILIEEDLTASGKDSGQAIYATAASWPVYGNLMTSGAPELTVGAASVPTARTYIKNTTNAQFTSLYLTASTTEDVKVTKIRVSADATTSATIGDFDDLLSTAVGADVLTLTNYLSNVSLYDGSTLLGTVTSLTSGTYSWYVDFTSLSLTVPKGTTKVIDIKAKVLNATDTQYFYFGVASTSGDVVGTGLGSGIAATVVNTGNAAGKGMILGSSGTMAVQKDVNSPISAIVADNTAGASFGKWKFTATNENILISKLVFEVTHSTNATGSSASYKDADLVSAHLATGTSPQEYAFAYSISDAATATCLFGWDFPESGTTTDNLILNLNAAGSSTCITDLTFSTNTSNKIVASASSTDVHSVELSDATLDASNTADNLTLGLKYGGTETLGDYAGSANSLVAGKVCLYDGTTQLSCTGLSSDVAGQVVFNFSSGSEIDIPYPGSKVLTLKADIADYLNAVEGSNLTFALGTTSDGTGSNYSTNFVVAKGKSSGTTLGLDDITNSSAATSGVLAADAMYIYGSKPVVSLNSASPSGPQTVGTSKEVFRFDVTVPTTGFDVTMNAIRFTIGTNATGSAWDKYFNLYKSTDSSTSLGRGLSNANATATDNAGWVTFYPETGNVIGDGSTVTYVVKSDTSEMDISAATVESLSISIQDGEFYWDDSLEANANLKVPNLPVQGNTLTY